MSDRLGATFERLRRANRPALIAYLTAGDPSMPQTVERVESLFCAGVDILELGVPFSDPLADGRVNVEAADRALRSGVRLRDVLEGVRAIRLRRNDPIVLYSYLNPLLARGFDANVRRMARAGVDGVLILDLPVEESSPFLTALDGAGVAPIFLVTPTSTAERMRRIAAAARGFVYCVSRTGVTGARRALSSEAMGVLQRMRRQTRLPLALGFGISTPAMARTAARLADAVVVGSALVERLHRSEGHAAERAAVMAWVRRMAAAVHGARHDGPHSRH